ncbi:hypothetical protein ACFL1B_02315 [Nanoarchaeota archaeon]
MKRLALFIIFVLLMPLALAQDNPDHIISNSADWRDVYSMTLYGNLLGVSNNFLASTPHSTLLLYSIPTNREHLQVITSAESPFIVGYEDVLQSRGYSEAEELVFDNANLELARLLPDIKKFIIVDDDYGYNALSVIPYAALARYYVIFTDELNIQEVSDFLDDQGVDELILFGQLDRDVRDELARFNPEVINVGDRFDNNLAIVDKYLAINPKKQAILTNGEFMEQGITSGADPVIFIGRTNVPDKVREYIQESDIDVGILIGNELIGAATFIRRQVGISVFVKFAQGARAPAGPISQVEDLDRFPMPRFELDLSIESVVYNRATGMLEVTYSNNADIATYFKSTITINGYDGSLATVGDENSIFIEGGTLKTITYSVNIPEDGANATIFTIFGEAPQSLENQLTATAVIEFVEISDRSSINILDFYYDAGSDQFVLEIENVGEVTAYIDAELLDLLINEEKVTIGGDEVLELKPGEKGKIYFSIELADEDIEDNPVIEVVARYGERKLALIKEARAEFEFKEKGVDYWYYILIAVIILLFFLILWRSRKCPECKRRGTIAKDHGIKYCKKCGWKEKHHQAHHPPSQSHSGHGGPRH